VASFPHFNKAGSVSIRCIRKIKRGPDPYTACASFINLSIYGYTRISNLLNRFRLNTKNSPQNIRGYTDTFCSAGPTDDVAIGCMRELCLSSWMYTDRPTDRRTEAEFIAELFLSPCIQLTACSVVFMSLFIA